MNTELRCWEASVWVGPDLNEQIRLYGEDVDTLKATAVAFLNETQPIVFSNLPRNSTLIKKIRNYFLINDSTAKQIRPFGQSTDLRTGWYLSRGFYKWSNPVELRIDDATAIYDRFGREDLIIEQGPDFKLIEKNSEGGQALLNLTPYIRWGLFGLFASICFLGIPVNGDDIHFLLRRGMLFTLGYIVAVTAIASIIGPFISDQLRAFNLLPHMDDLS